MAMLNNQMVTVRVPNSGIWIALMTGSSIMKKALSKYIDYVHLTFQPM